MPEPTSRSILPSPSTSPVATAVTAVVPRNAVPVSPKPGLVPFARTKLPVKRGPLVTWRKPPVTATWKKGPPGTTTVSVPTVSVTGVAEVLTWTTTLPPVSRPIDTLLPRVNVALVTWRAAARPCGVMRRAPLPVRVARPPRVTVKPATVTSTTPAPDRRKVSVVALMVCPPTARVVPVATSLTPSPVVRVSMETSTELLSETSGTDTSSEPVSVPQKPALLVVKDPLIPVARTIGAEGVPRVSAPLAIATVSDPVPLVTVTSPASDCPATVSVTPVPVTTSDGSAAANFSWVVTPPTTKVSSTAPVPASWIRTPSVPASETPGTPTRATVPLTCPAMPLAVTSRTALPLLSVSRSRVPSPNAAETLAAAIRSCVLSSAVPSSLSAPSEVAFSTEMSPRSACPATVSVTPVPVTLR